MSHARLRLLTVMAALLAAPGFLFVTADALLKAADAPPAAIERLERGPERAATALRGARAGLKAAGAKFARGVREPEPTAALWAPPVPAGPDELAVPIIVYHNVREHDAPRRRADEPYYVTPAQLEAEFAWLQQEGYESVSFDDLLAAFEGAPLPPKPVIIAFDDAREEQYGRAFPLLREHGLTATFFVFTNAMGRPGYLTWAQLEEMRDAGMAVGSHSVHHPYLTKADDETLRRELVDSRAALEERLGVIAPCFAYPFGLSDDRVMLAARDAGYRCGRGLAHATVARREALFDLPGRIAVGDLPAFRRMMLETAGR